MAANNSSTLVGLDIGTTKIAVCIGLRKTDGEMEVIGIGTHPSSGVRDGLIVDIDATVQAMRAAIQEAQTMANHTVKSVLVSIGGEHVKGVNSHGNAAIRTGEVGTEELELALESARAVPLSNDENIVHVIPQEYIIDWQDGIREPRGMSGTRMDANVHVITCAKNAVRNITKCVNLCDVGMDGVVVEPLAASSSVLSEDEFELGVCVIDIGGGTTDVAVYSNGAIRHTEVFPMAGGSVTKDIAMTFRTPAQHAEDIKIKYACALQDLTDEEEQIRVPGVDDRASSELSRYTIASVVESRYRELLEHVKASMEKAGISKDRLRSGVVLTGGAAKMEGVTELAEEVFHLPVSRGTPRNLKGLDGILDNPAYATCAGLLVYGNHHNGDVRFSDRQQPKLMQKLMRYVGKGVKKTYEQI